MAIQYNDFIHPSDRKALEALKALPGFDYLVKKFMNIYSERVNKLENTSSMIKIGEKQLPHIYNILLKVCNRLEISVPELYLTADRTLNAYTMGDTEVFIVLNSGLFETLSLEQIETIIAHECGHILCHHNLYTTMAIYIMRGSEYFINGPISNAVFTALQYAFFYWMRCSEFSADRVAAYYHGTSEPVVNVMMALAGATNNLGLEFSQEEFFNQALEYKKLVDDSTYNKVLEFITFGLNTHPLLAYRAYEIDEFYKKYTAKISSVVNAVSGEEVVDKSKYNLHIRYKFIKSKSLLKIGGIINNNQLEVKIGESKYLIDKNDTIDIELENGEYELLMNNSIQEIKYTVNLRYDMSIIVSWEYDNEMLSVIEEI